MTDRERRELDFTITPPTAEQEAEWRRLDAEWPALEHELLDAAAAEHHGPSRLELAFALTCLLIHAAALIYLAGVVFGGWASWPA